MADKGETSMELYLDTADLAEIRRLYELYPLDGVTTNPGILARAGGDPVKALRGIRDIIGPDALMFAQVIPSDAEGMVRDARAILKLLGDNTVVKVPAVPEGFRAIRLLSKQGVRTCGTVVYVPMQGFMAAKAGAEYVAPYVNRIDNLGYDGVGVSTQLHDMIAAHGLPAKVLAASFRNTQQVQDLCRHGIAAATCAPAVLEGLVKNPAVDGAVRDFADAFAGLAGEENGMAELVG